ncbi:hypothetical protein IH922_01830, partial [candidate division KSB1 bacterium]|nr:hypothetical protein [candidate division KSB1 bacterium]
KGGKREERDEDRRKEEKEKWKTIKRVIKIEQLAIEDSNDKLNNLLEEVGIPVESAKLLDERIRKVESTIENYNELNKIISLASKTALTTIERNVNKISELFGRYKELKREKKENELRIRAMKSILAAVAFFLRCIFFVTKIFGNIGVSR